MNTIIKTTLLKNYFLTGANGAKLWQFPTHKMYAYDMSQEPLRLTANYKGRCDDTLFQMQG
jgi:hypothetical protein|tara:strand:- start:29 stop:211 length:183 start_codon:yes stop_codon:yes gene_type:complete